MGLIIHQKKKEKKNVPKRYSNPRFSCLVLWFYPTLNGNLRRTGQQARRQATMAENFLLEDGFERWKSWHSVTSYVWYISLSKNQPQPTAPQLAQNYFCNKRQLRSGTPTNRKLMAPSLKSNIKPIRLEGNWKVGIREKDLTCWKKVVECHVLQHSYSTLSWKDTPCRPEQKGISH